MNSLKIINNIIEDYQDEYLIIKDNSLTFLKDNEYNIEYYNCTNINLIINLKPNISVKLFILSKDNKLKITTTYNLEEESNLLISKFYANYETNEQVIANLKGRNGTFTSNFSSLSKTCENYYLTINHYNHSTKSFISNKCISEDNSSINFTIDSILPKGNIDCIMDQTTKILTLGDAKAKVKPNMFIEEDSVEAKHGSVISTFNEEDLFYLTSRGIPKNEAIYLLIKGFILSNLNLNMDNRIVVIDCINNIPRR